MTYDIKHFYWDINADNCIAILNYEFQGVCEVVNDSYKNDESPSCTFTINDVQYKLFFPSDYKGDYSNFALFDSTDYENEKFVDHYPTIDSLLDYFRNLNVI
jgi:hypothetical protein